MAARWRRCCAIITIITVLITLVVFIALTSRAYSCDLVHEEPQFNLSAIKNIHSFDFTTLANFAGYMRYELQDLAVHDNQQQQQQQRILTLSYLPINVDFITLFAIKEGSYAFTINADCAEILFNLETRGKMVRVVDISISLTKVNIGGDECHIDSPPIEMLNDGYYSCPETRTYKCDQKKGPEFGADDHPGLIMTLVIDKLEFEIAGDPNKIRLDQFSKRINPCKV